MSQKQVKKYRRTINKHKRSIEDGVINQLVAELKSTGRLERLEIAWRIIFNGSL